MSSLLDLLEDPNKVEENRLESHLDYVQTLFPDVREYRSLALKNMAPRPELFSIQAMAQRPGMAYLANMNLQLLYPSTKDPQAQITELNSHFDLITSYCQRTTQFYQQVPVWANSLIDQPILGFDTETEGLDKRVLYDKYGRLREVTKIAGICLAVDANTGYYFPFLHTEEDGIPNWSREARIHLLDRIYAETIPVVHNTQYDNFISQINGCTTIRPYPYVVDTQIGCFLYRVDEKKNGLKNMAEVLLGRPMMKIEKLFGFDKANDFVAFNRICASDAYVYGALDPCNTIGLFFFLLQSPDNPFLNQGVVAQIDHELANTLIDLYKPGAPIDYDYNLHALHDCTMRADMLEQFIYQEMGMTFALGSPKQLSEVIFDNLGVQPLAKMEKGKGGSWPTGEEILEELADANPHVTGLVAIVDFRKIGAAAKKTHAKFVSNSFTDYRDPVTRVEVDFNSTNVPTGRLSSGSGSERSGVFTKFKKGSMNIHNQAYHKGDWVWGGNSQGIGAASTIQVPLRRITKHPLLDLDNPYPPEVRMKAAAKVADIT